MKKIDFINLETRESPKEILEADFPSLGKLPISGGWGYDQKTACVIDRNHPCVDPSVPFNGVALEYAFVEYRLYEELIVFRPEGEKYAGIKRKLIKQRSLEIDRHRYDILHVGVEAFREEDFLRLKESFEGPNGFRNPSFDMEGHEQLHNSLLRSGEREYWFDITSFFGVHT